MNIKILLSVLFSFLFGVITIAQDFSGTWRGVFHTDTRNFRRSFQFSIQLQQKGRALLGIYITKDTLTKNGSYCICKVSGQLWKKNKELFTLYQEGVAAYNISYVICDFVNFLDLKYLRKSKYEYLTGKWYGKSPNSRSTDGAGGSFALMKTADTINADINNYFPNQSKLIQRYNRGDTFYMPPKKNTNKVSVLSKSKNAEQKKPVEERENIIIKNIVIDTSKIEVDLYDNGDIDNDTISVYLNGQIILNNYRLTDKPKKLQLQMDRNADNEIVIVAENLGDIPPNTGLMVITVNNKRYEINLSSSFQTNAKIIVRVKKSLSPM